ncbi:VWA domain-containing protein [bacterium]|jgi:hypothetical protein|nr:VWA domain-containing protein [bacterium]
MDRKLKKLLAAALVGSALIMGGCGENKKFVYPIKEPGARVEMIHNLQSAEMRQGGDVDILWVIDNSGSMGTYQKQVIANTSMFINEFVRKAGGLNWRMGLISTDLADEPYIGMKPADAFDSRSHSVVSRFQNAVAKLGTGGDSTEQMFAPLKKVMKNNSWFFRKNAALAIILVTDVDEGVDLTVKIDPVAMAKELKAYKGRNTVLLYGVFGMPDIGGMNCPAESTGYTFKASRYKQFFDQFPYQVYPACDPKFGQNLAELGRDLVNKIINYTPRIPLTTVPMPETLKLTYDGKILPGGSPDNGGFWSYEQDENMIYFPDLSFSLETINDVVISYVPAVQ